jgi:rubrerythrin
MSVTEKNVSKAFAGLQEAFAGESQANRKYLAFAQKADSEGYPQVARMFRAAAEAETVHALNHLRAMGGIAGTRENLQAAIAGETFEFETMYPPFIAAAKSEGNTAAQRSFEWANRVEAAHAALYQNLFDNLDKNGEQYDYYVCPLCGHTVGKSFPDICPVCGGKGSAAKKIS